jgi:hypothetical protein
LASCGDRAPTYSRDDASEDLEVHVPFRWCMRRG